MGNVTEGAKAGVLAGIVYGLIMAPVAYYALVALRSEILKIISASLPYGISISAEQILELTYTIIPMVMIIGGLILGLLLGAVYGWIYERIPGATAIAKGLVFGIVVWVLITVIGGYGNIRYGLDYYLASVASGLGAAMAYGLIVSVLYSRLTRIH